MRKFYFLLIALAFVGCATFQSQTSATKDKEETKEETTAVASTRNIKQEDLKTVMGGEVTQAKANDILGIGVNSTIVVEEKEGRVYITITNPLITPKGDTKGKGLKPAVRLKMASGILDAAGKKPYFAVVQVTDGKAEFDLPNFAKAVKEPIVEHVWGYGESSDGSVGYLVLDPESSWVSYETKDDKPDLETLAIGLVMYPDKQVEPLKALGKGKLVQGRHSELK